MIQVRSAAHVSTIHVEYQQGQTPFPRGVCPVDTNPAVAGLPRAKEVGANWRRAL